MRAGFFKSWKDTAYETIPMSNFWTRVFWHGCRLQDAALKPGGMDSDIAHKMAVRLVIEEDTLGLRLDFDEAC